MDGPEYQIVPSTPGEWCMKTEILVIGSGIIVSHQQKCRFCGGITLEGRQA
jgi:hypothetical protein